MRVAGGGVAGGAPDGHGAGLRGVAERVDAGVRVAGA